MVTTNCAKSEKVPQMFCPRLKMFAGVQPVFTCSQLTIETLEQGMKCVQVNNKDTRTTPNMFKVNNKDICYLYC